MLVLPAELTHAQAPACVRMLADALRTEPGPQAVADATELRVFDSSALAVLSTIAVLLLIVGGLNWALVGLFNFDLVAALLGNMSVASRIVYVLVGIGAIYSLILLPRFTRLS